MRTLEDIFRYAVQDRDIDRFIAIGTFTYVNSNGDERSIQLSPGGLFNDDTYRYDILMSSRKWINLNNGTVIFSFTPRLRCSARTGIKAASAARAYDLLFAIRDNIVTTYDSLEEWSEVKVINLNVEEQILDREPSTNETPSRYS